MVEADTPIPDHCLRGLRESKWVSEGFVSAAAFIPDERTSATRMDGARELSVTWEDRAEAMAILFRTKTQSAHGAARLPRREVEHLSAQPMLRDALQAVRDPFPGDERNPPNPHHGLILFAGHLPAHVVRALAGALAVVSEIVPRP